MDSASVFRLIAYCTILFIGLSYAFHWLYCNYSKYNHLSRIKNGDKFIIVEAVGEFRTIIYTKVTCVENDTKNKSMLIRGKYSNGALFAKAYKYDAWNFKDFNLMQKVFHAIEDEIKNIEKEEQKELTLSEALLKSEELLAKADMFEDAAKVRDIKNKVLQNA